MAVVLIGLSLLIHFVFNNENYYVFIVPLTLLLIEIEKFLIPYITLENNFIQKRSFLRKHRINLDNVEYIKNVFGDIQIKGPDKIIKIDKDEICQEDKEELLEVLTQKTHLQLV
jgi:hypothetical protein